MCDGEDKHWTLARLLSGIELFVVTSTGDVTPFELGERLIRPGHGMDGFVDT